jgi:hypothetical protein
MSVIPTKAEVLFNGKAGQSIYRMHQSKVDSSLLKAEHIHVLSPRARFRALLSGKTSIR